MTDCTRSAVSVWFFQGMVLSFILHYLFSKDYIYRLKASDLQLEHVLGVAFKQQSCVCAQTSMLSQLASTVTQIERWETETQQQDQTLR